MIQLSNVLFNKTQKNSKIRRGRGRDRAGAQTWQNTHIWEKTPLNGSSGENNCVKKVPLFSWHAHTGTASSFHEGLSTWILSYTTIITPYFFFLLDVLPTYPIYKFVESNSLELLQPHWLNNAQANNNSIESNRCWMFTNWIHWSTLFFFLFCLI